MKTRLELERIKAKCRCQLLDYIRDCMEFGLTNKEMHEITDVIREVAGFSDALFPCKPERKKRGERDYKVCEECVYLSDEKCSIGRLCTNPQKVWRSSSAKWHSPSCKACKMFVEKD